MKKIIGICLLFFAFVASAEEMSMSAPTPAPASAESNHLKAVELYSELKNAEPSWKFELGQAKADFASGDATTGSGLAIGVGYEFTSLLGVEMTYANMKIEHSYHQYDGYSETYTDGTYSDRANMFAAALAVTPIRYDYHQVGFAGSLLLGEMSFANKSGPFYGAALTASLNKQIGISVDSKVRIKDSTASGNLDSTSQISLIGYY